MATLITLTGDSIAFAEFKTKLRDFEEVEKMFAAKSDENVMKIHGGDGRRPPRINSREQRGDDTEMGRRGPSSKRMSIGDLVPPLQK